MSPGYSGIKGTEARAECRKMRKRVDLIDSQIIDLIAQRMAVVKIIREHKHRISMPIWDPGRERELEHRWQVRASNLGLNHRKIIRILKELLCMSREFQKRARK